MRLFSTDPTSIRPEGLYESRLRSKVAPEHIAPRLDGFSDGWAAARAADRDNAVVHVLRIDTKAAVPALAQKLFDLHTADTSDSADLVWSWDQLHPSVVGLWERRASEILYGLPKAP